MHSHSEARLGGALRLCCVALVFVKDLVTLKRVSREVSNKEGPNQLIRLITLIHKFTFSSLYHVSCFSSIDVKQTLSTFIGCNGFYQC